MVSVNVKKRNRRARNKPAQRAVGKAKQVTLLGQALRSLGGLGGGALGGFVGAPATGATVGTSLGAALSRWLGSGDYTVVTNSMVKAGPVIPSMHSTGQSIIVRHKEFLGPVLGSVDFKVQQTYILNPGIAQTFPWLSRIAACFQEHTFKGAVFHYVPTSGVAISGTNPAIGSVMLQTSYRSTEAEPVSKMELLNEYWASESAPNETLAHPIECSPVENPFKVQYVRTGALTLGDTPLMYDLGKTFLATQGMPADNNPVGDLWVTYEIELRKPVVHSNVAPSQEYLFATSYLSSLALPFKSIVFDPPDIGASAVGQTISIPYLQSGVYYCVITIDPDTGFSINSCDMTIGAITVANGTTTTIAGTIMGALAHPGLNICSRAFALDFPIAGPTLLTVPTFTVTFNNGTTFSMTLRLLKYRNW